MENDQIISAFQKSETDEVRLTLRHFKGKAYLDLRVYFRTKDAGEFKPTRKGLTFPVKHAADLERAFNGLTHKTAGELVATA